VVVVRAGSQGLEIMIDPPVPAGAGRFEAIDDGRVWRIDPDVDLAELEVLAADRWPILPALVSVGTSTDGAVLANLEHAGSVTVDGDPVMVTAVLQQVIVELASYPWSEETLAGLHTFGDPHLSVLPPGVTPAPEEIAIAEVVDRLADRYRSDLADRPSAAAARAADAGWEPHVTVAFPDADPRSLRCLLEAATPDNSGAVAVCAASDLPTRWRLHVSGDGTAFLDGMAGEDPFRLALHIEARSESLEALSAGLSTAAEPGDAAPVIDLRASPLNHQSERGLVEIGILGGIEVIGGAGIEAIEPRRRTSALAVLAYLVTHREPASTADLTQALWPLDPSKVDFGEPSKSAVNNAVSQARKVLGRDPNGEDLLVYNREGYRLGRSVTCDWDRFQHLTAIAAQRTPTDGLAIYREALELVRSTPFHGALNSPRFEWVSSEHLDITIICRVVDAAESLAEGALALEDYPTVQWAVTRGLELDPAREQLYQYWMHALGRSGSTERLNEVYGRLCTMLRRRIHELQDPTDESHDIWQSYTGKRAARQ
jgi:DNA-binding SARP family transcriptional activator